MYFGFCPCGRVAWFLIYSANDFANGDAELASKFKVALVMGRHTHDGTGTVAHQHIVGDPDWHFLSIDRVGYITTGKDASLVLLGTHAVDLGHAPRFIYIGLNLSFVFRR